MLYIPWTLYIILTSFNSVLLCYLSYQYFADSTDLSTALTYYFSCFGNNLFWSIAFYLSAFIPVIFALRFLSCQLCEEYYVIRLRSRRKFMFLKVASVILLLLVSIIIQLFVFSIFSTSLFPQFTMEVSRILPIVFHVLLTRILLHLIVSFFFFLTKNYITIFIILTAIFLFSLSTTTCYLKYSLCWIYGINLINFDLKIMIGDLICILTIAVLLYNFEYDVLSGDGKSE